MAGPHLSARSNANCPASAARPRRGLVRSGPQQVPHLTAVKRRRYPGTANSPVLPEVFNARDHFMSKLTFPMVPVKAKGARSR